MKCNRLVFGIAALCAIVGMSGCGGSGSTSPSFPTGTLNFNGAATTADTSTATSTVPATGGTTITTTGGLTAVIPSGVAPAGTTYPAGTQFAIIPIGVGFPGAEPAGSQLSINGVANSGALVGTNGLLTVNVALPVTAAGIDYSITFPNATLSTTKVLTIAQITFSGKFYLLLGPVRVVSPVPTNLSGRLPNNGQNAAGSQVTSLFGNGNNGRATHLKVDYGTGFLLNQAQTIASSKANFANFSFDGQNVPNNGVQLVAFEVGDL